MANNSKALGDARKAKKDEFYTQLADIERELQHYRKHFQDKVVLCNCDDPYESNFFKYFALNFNRLGLRRLVCTCYNGSSIAGNELVLPGFGGEPKKKAFKVEISEVRDLNGDGAVDLSDVRILLENDRNTISELQTGDFRSDECVALLKQADIVCTNPPFSLFREYLGQLMEYGKKFLIIGNINCVTYKEVFPLIQQNKVWLGPSITSGDRKFYVPDDYPLNASGCGIDENGRRYIRVKGVRWFTNLDHNKRHEPLDPVCRYTPEQYPKYDNYDAIEVGRTADIPCDYDGAMGVPITFLDKYNPDEFEILGITDRGNEFGLKTKEYSPNDSPNYGDLNRRASLLVNGQYKSTYARLLIRNLHPKQSK